MKAKWWVATLVSTLCLLLAVSVDTEENTQTGFEALSDNTTGEDNTATGFEALSDNATGSDNTATGSWALTSNATGSANTATGSWALSDNATGNYNTATGSTALSDNTTGSDNTATGFEALNNNTTGNYNTAIGSNVLNSNVAGSRNTAIGVNALNNATGNYNVAIGVNAGTNLNNGNNNICIGNEGDADDSGVIRIGSGTGDNIQTSTYIAGVSGVPITAGSLAPAYISQYGQLGVQASSRRFKEAIEPLSSADESILQLRPVRFRYKDVGDHGAQPLQYGLVAEEVAQIMPELVQLDEDGQPFAVKYQFLAPLLLAQVQQQQALLTTLKEENEVLRQEMRALRQAVSP